MASPSESRNIASEDTEVTSEHRHHGHHQHQQLPAVREAARELDLELPLVRQSSIYSLTLDEIQNAVCEPGKTFGSMNMDEFLTNIWNAEEGQAAGAAANPGAPPPIGNLSNSGGASGGQLRRQESLTLPAPLCRKTVDEVWAEIHRDAVLRSQQADHRATQENGESGAPRQPTLGEMTLEDFLIKAGVVREGYAGGGAPAAPPAPVTQPQYGMAGFQIPATEVSQQFGHMVGVAGYVDHQQGIRAAPMANGIGYPMGNGYVANGYGIGSPASPGGSSEGMGGGPGDSSATAMVMYGGLEGGAEGRGMGSRKRAMENGTGTADRVVERRQRRMIKNRESAARSRARKQAYTVELEAELNLLKEENARLKEEQRRTMQLRRKLLLETIAEQARTNVSKTVRSLRRCNTSPW